MLFKFCCIIKIFYENIVLIVEALSVFNVPYFCFLFSHLLLLNQLWIFVDIGQLSHKNLTLNMPLFRIIYMA